MCFSEWWVRKICLWENPVTVLMQLMQLVNAAY